MRIFDEVTRFVNRWRAGKGKALADTEKAGEKRSATVQQAIPPVDEAQRREKYLRALAAFKSLCRRCANRVGVGQIHQPSGKADAHPPGYFWKRDRGARDGVGTPRWRLYRTRAL